MKEKDKQKVLRDTSQEGLLLTCKILLLIN